MTRRKRGEVVTFERATVEQDDYGEEISSWAAICQEKAQVFYGRGDERREAAMEQGEQAANFNVPSNDATRGVTLKDRINFADRLWDIEGIAPDTPSRRRIEFTATRAG